MATWHSNYADYIAYYDCPTEFVWAVVFGVSDPRMQPVRCFAKLSVNDKIAPAVTRAAIPFN